MAEIVEDDWPIVTGTFEDSSAVEETKAFLGAFGRWLSRGEPFGVLLEKQSFGSGGDKEAMKLRDGWVAENRDLIEQYCREIALVTDSRKMLRLFRPVTKRVASRKFGCPDVMYRSRSEAWNWLDERVPTAEP